MIHLSCRIQVIRKQLFIDFSQVHNKNSQQSLNASRSFILTILSNPLSPYLKKLYAFLHLRYYYLGIFTPILQRFYSEYS